ncbi:ABC transporter ATP-binding protein [Limibaculum sp. M0105]|uniref:ABC transporter ATP-binding protein n=1 Tax=Thermohalobaculum xanthum TaxID=2753746 RepID=A0A8J7MBB3_9RHOB|nr:ABC transporter ATP-binding protein [Thermohalobaculum xanthum]MBK0401004.1 ABC transporter ATP-binding protein [Thermohalobaculum xanthum]
MSVPLVEARGVTRILPLTVPVRLVEDVDLAVGPGELVAITGPSGSGKSSLLYLLGILDAPTSGEILLNGEKTHAMTSDQRAALRLRGIGFVFQFHFLLPEFSVIDNVAIPMRRLGALSGREIEARSADILTRLGLADHMRKRPEQLSGGQRQRVAVARALANDPPLILADEPTGSLDSAASEQVFEILSDIAGQDGKSVIAVTHDTDMAERMDRRVHLIDGRIVSDERRRPERPTGRAPGPGAAGIPLE